MKGGEWPGGSRWPKWAICVLRLARLRGYSKEMSGPGIVIPGNLARSARAG